MVSLGHLIQEAVGDLYHLDSRLWRTLRLLLLRPGQLTVEYLAGRRARYAPPFRLYLVFSVLLFVLTLHLSGKQSSAFVIDDRADAQRTLEAVTAALATKRTEFERLGLNDERRAQIDALTERLEKLRAGQPKAGQPNSDCDSLRFSGIGGAMIETRLREVCHKIAADNGKSLRRAIFDNLPKMMFVFLPLIALVNKILYLRSRRYYVEHLLFFVHLHVFVFLILCLIMFGNFLLALVPGGVNPPQIVSAVVSIGMLSYVFFALRRVYGQGRVKTFIKFGFLLVAYTISLGLTTLATALYSALTL